MADFFYDGQIRRYLLQIIRAFSDIKIEVGPDENGTTTQQRVPVIYGDMSWMVAQILKGQTENTALPSPMMSVWITKIEMAPERRSDPALESKISGTERLFDKNTGTYTSDVGKRSTIERYMPVPYTLGVQLDIWSTTTTTKLQILEQLMMIFNPSVQLQQNTNPFDWTSIFEMEMTNITWSNRSIPVGTEMERDVASLEFNIPIWINPPAKVKRISIVEEIITNIHEASSSSITSQSDCIHDPFGCLGNLITQIIVTPGNFKIGVGIDGYNNNEVVLLNKYGIEDDSLSWKELIELYGSLSDRSILRLKLDENIEEFDNDILGEISLDPNRKNVLQFNIIEDTLPPTVPFGTIDNVIDPQEVWPGNGLPPASPGQRYLLIGNLTNGEEGAIPENTTGRNPWGYLNANENDIIEYNGGSWMVIFDSSTENDNQFVINASNGNHYRFKNNSWTFTYLGKYDPGYWRLENIDRPLDTPPDGKDDDIDEYGTNDCGDCGDGG